MCLKNWEPSYGPIPEASVVTENIFGKDERGVWRLQGKAGHYELEEFEESAVCERTREHDSREVPPAFAEEALQRRREAAMTAVHGQHRARQDVATDSGPQLSLADVMKVLEAGQALGATATEVSASGNEAEADDDAALASGGDSDCREDGGLPSDTARARLRA